MGLAGTPWVSHMLMVFAGSLRTPRSSVTQNVVLIPLTSPHFIPATLKLDALYYINAPEFNCFSARKDSTFTYLKPAGLPPWVLLPCILSCQVIFYITHDPVLETRL